MNAHMNSFIMARGCAVRWHFENMKTEYQLQQLLMAIEWNHSKGLQEKSTQFYPTMSEKKIRSEILIFWPRCTKSDK